MQLLAHPVAGEHHHAQLFGQCVAQGGLAGAGQAPDEDQPDLGGVQVARGDVGVVVGLLAGFVMD